MPYTHLSPFERFHIELLARLGHSIRCIAREVGRSPSTISRELVRNRSPRAGYRAITAQQAYHQRRTRSVKPRRVTVFEFRYPLDQKVLQLFR